jgi:hypothetical protein
MLKSTFYRAMILFFVALSTCWAQSKEPISVSGELFPTSTVTYRQSNVPVDNTARGLLVLKNQQAVPLKNISIEAQFFHVDGQLLFTDLQKADLKPGATADVFFMWSNPSRALIDRVEAVVSGEVNGKAFSVKQVLKIPPR